MSKLKNSTGFLNALAMLYMYSDGAGKITLTFGKGGHLHFVNPEIPIPTNANPITEWQEKNKK